MELTFFLCVEENVTVYECNMLEIIIQIIKTPPTLFESQTQTCRICFCNFKLLFEDLLF